MKLRIALNIGLSAGLLAVAATVAGWLIAHRRKPPETAPERVAPRVLAPPVQPRLNERVRIVGYGSARPRVQVEISAQVTGLVVAKADNLLSGKYVRRGQELFRIEQTDYDLAVQRVRTRIDLLNAQLARLDQEEKNLLESKKIETGRIDVAQREVARVGGLLARNIATDTELDKAREVLLSRQGQLQGILNQLALIEPQRAQLRAEIASADVELRQAQADLARCVVSSPVTGRVLTCEVEAGERVQAGTRCGQLYGTDIMDVPVSIAATDLEWIGAERLETCKRGAGVAPGEGIEALVEWEGPGNGRRLRWPGCVERIEAGLEAETRTAVLVVRVTNPGPRREPVSTRPGRETPAGEEPASGEGRPILEVNMFCKVTILGRRLAKAYVLPRQAILPDEHLYVIADGKLAKRPVKVARLASEEAMILPGGGVEDGDRVVIGVIPKPVIGMTVEPLAVEAPIAARRQ